MKVPGWTLALLAGLIISGPAAYGEECSKDPGHDGYLIRLDQRGLRKLWQQREERQKKAEAEKAKAEEKAAAER